MAATFTALSRFSPMRELEAAYQWLYGTTDKMRRTDRALFLTIVTMTILHTLNGLASGGACGIGVL